MIEALPSMKKRSWISSPVPAAFNWCRMRVPVLGVDQIIHCVINVEVKAAPPPPDDSARIDLGNEIPSCIPPPSESSYSSEPSSQPHIVGIGFGQTQAWKNCPFSRA